MRQGQILDGRQVANALFESLKKKLDSRPLPRRPGLAIIQVGNDTASTSYIKQKANSAKALDLYYEHHHLSDSATESDVERIIEKLANSSLIDGILLQLPLASHALNHAEASKRLLLKIPPEKDVDGLHPWNQGALMGQMTGSQNWQHPMACTALGILRLLDFYKIPLQGKRVAQVGVSKLVGLPTALLLMQRGATPTLCHSRTENLFEVTQDADIIVMAAGKKHLLKAEGVKPGAVLIDVGIHRDEKTQKLTGDIAPEAYAKASAYSPVPGGVGPMTVAVLIENTIELFFRSLDKKST